MPETQASSQDKSADSKTFTIETNIMVLARVAVIYSCRCRTAPVRLWGRDLAGNSLRVGNDRYQFGERRFGGKLGVHVVCRVNEYRKELPQDIKQLFFAYDGMANIQATCMGEVLGEALV